MLVRFKRAGPVKAGPLSIHGLEGQIAALDGDDLTAALTAGMVEEIGGEAPPEPPKKRGRKPAVEKD